MTLRRLEPKKGSLIVYIALLLLSLAAIILLIHAHPNTPATPETPILNDSIRLPETDAGSPTFLPVSLE